MQPCLSARQPVSVGYGERGFIVMFEDSAPGRVSGIDRQRDDARIEAAASCFPGQSVGRIVGLGSLAAPLPAGGDPWVPVVSGYRSIGASTGDLRPPDSTLT